MSILVPDIAASYGGLDSLAFVDGGVPSAHILRELARQANRLAVRGHPLLQLIYDSGGLVTESGEGALVGWGWPFWVQITPGPITVPKKPGLELGRLHVRSYSRTNEELYIQVVTDRSPFNARAEHGGSSTVRIVGTGAFQWTTLSDIPLDYSDFEHVSIFLRGLPTTTVGVTATNGSPNVGTVTRIHSTNLLEDSTTPATWNISGGTIDWGINGHCVTIENSTAQQLLEARWITRVFTATQLQVFPGWPGGLPTDFASGATYRIFEIPRWRIANLALYAQDRTS